MLHYVVHQFWTHAISQGTSMEMILPAAGGLKPSLPLRFPLDLTGWNPPVPWQLQWNPQRWWLCIGCWLVMQTLSEGLGPFSEIPGTKRLMPFETAEACTAAVKILSLVGQLYWPWLKEVDGHVWFGIQEFSLQNLMQTCDIGSNFEASLAGRRSIDASLACAASRSLTLWRLMYYHSTGLWDINIK